MNKLEGVLTPGGLLLETCRVIMLFSVPSIENGKRTSHRDSSLSQFRSSAESAWWQQLWFGSVRHRTDDC